MGEEMKAGWERRRLVDVLNIQNGYAFDSKGFNPTKGVPLVRIRSLKAGIETETRFDGEYDARYLVRAGDLLVGMDGEFGCYEWKGEPSLLNQRVCRLQGFSHELLPRFLYYGVNDYLKAIEEVTGFATVKHLSSKQILEIEFPVPPLREQQRIVTILDQAFASIATAKANAEKNLQNSRGLFESHLQSVFTQRGEGWVEKKLGDVCELFQGLCINAKTKHLLVEKSSLPLLRIKDLRTNSAEQFVAESGWPKNAHVCESEIIYTRTGQIGLVFRGRVGILHNNCFKVRPKPVLNTDYLFWWLQNPAFRAKITILASKAAQPDITHSLFKEQPILLPPRDYQDQAIALIDKMRAETQRLESIYQQKLAALEALKKSLLHQAFSGQL
ncbi:MAG: restriction endonuclease subunit S [Deltaproteobacteria bacterium]|uniref:restriction endonuclease subunit S n=1 Tax=Hydrosulfovibrio ferrireducens TaxID=2934181 RepID=UPI0012254C3C|nr:MAG: restriction endonuclease subunit S [Deltaproteobacteria bacterium]